MPTVGSSLMENIKDPDLKEHLAQIEEAMANAQTKEQLAAVVKDLSNTVNDILAAHNKTPDFMTKIKSRKFWIAILGAFAGICGMLNSGGNVVAIVVFVLLEIVSIAGYFLVEGTLDASRTKEMIQAATSIAEIITSLTPMLQDSSDAEAEETVEETSTIEEDPA